MRELDRQIEEAQRQSRRRAEAYQLYCSIVSGCVAKCGFVPYDVVKGLIVQAYAYRDLFYENSPREVKAEAAGPPQPS